MRAGRDETEVSYINAMTERPTGLEVRRNSPMGSLLPLHDRPFSDHATLPDLCNIDVKLMDCVRWR